MPHSRPVVAITLGDPSSVGPEIVVKALASGGLTDVCVPVVVGDARFVRRALGTTGAVLDVSVIARPGGATGLPGRAEVVDVPAYGVDGIGWGRIQAPAGRAAFEAIRASIDLALAGEVDAVATAPVNKEAFRAAGVTQIGHTEIFGELTGTRDPLTMFEVKGLRIFFLTRHLSLAEAIRRITAERTLDALRRSAAALGTLGVTSPRLAVAALNPHGGEHGLFGDEEERELAPAIARAREEGIKKGRVHILLDGRDVGETSALEYVDPFEEFLAAVNRDKGADFIIASGGGRMLVTMDRYEADWAVVERGWKAHVHGEGEAFGSAREAIETFRKRDKGVTDQFLPPFVIRRGGEPAGPSTGWISAGRTL